MYRLSKKRVTEVKDRIVRVKKRITEERQKRRKRIKDGRKGDADSLPLPGKKRQQRKSERQREKEKSKCDVTSQQQRPIDSSSPPSLQIETTPISNFKTKSNRAVLWAAKRGSRRSLADGECCFSVIAASCPPDASPFLFVHARFSPAANNAPRRRSTLIGVANGFSAPVRVLH